MRLTESAAPLCRSLNRADAQRERERPRERERERERERGVCARWESKTSRSRGSTGNSQKLNKVWPLFWREKKSLKGSAMLLSCAYPFLQLRVGPRVKQNTRCVNRALIKLVPLKWICVNALLTFLTLNMTNHLLLTLNKISGGKYREKIFIKKNLSTSLKIS